MFREGFIFPRCKYAVCLSSTLVTLNKYILESALILDYIRALVKMSIEAFVWPFVSQGKKEVPTIQMWEWHIKQMLMALFSLVGAGLSVFIGINISECEPLENWLCGGNLLAWLALPCHNPAKQSWSDHFNREHVMHWQSAFHQEYFSLSMRLFPFCVWSLLTHNSHLLVFFPGWHFKWGSWNYC